MLARPFVQDAGDVRAYAPSKGGNGPLDGENPSPGVPVLRYGISSFTVRLMRWMVEILQLMSVIIALGLVARYDPNYLSDLVVIATLLSGAFILERLRTHVLPRIRK